MNIRLHKNARTTPAVRACLCNSDKTRRELGLGIGTIRKWQRRESTEDRSHISHNLQTTLSKAQEAPMVELRKSLKLPLDDLLAVTHEFINANVSRSGLDRCLRRHGVARLSVPVTILRMILSRLLMFTDRSRSHRETPVSRRLRPSDLFSHG